MNPSSKERVYDLEDSESPDVSTSRTYIYPRPGREGCPRSLRTRKLLLLHPGVGRVTFRKDVTKPRERVWTLDSGPERRGLTLDRRK